MSSFFQQFQGGNNHNSTLKLNGHKQKEEGRIKIRSRENSQKQFQQLYSQNNQTQSPINNNVNNFGQNRTFQKNKFNIQKKMQNQYQGINQVIKNQVENDRLKDKQVFLDQYLANQKSFSKKNEFQITKNTFAKHQSYKSQTPHNNSNPTMYKNNSLSSNNQWTKRGLRPPKTSTQINYQTIDANKDFLKPKFANEDEGSKKQEIERELKDLNHFAYKHQINRKNIGRENRSNLKNNNKSNNFNSSNNNKENSSGDESYSNTNKENSRIFFSINKNQDNEKDTDKDNSNILTNHKGNSSSTGNLLGANKGYKIGQSQSMSNNQFNSSTRLPKLNSDLDKTSKINDQNENKRDSTLDRKFKQDGVIFGQGKKQNSSRSNIYITNFNSKPQSNNEIEDQENLGNKQKSISVLQNIKENNQNNISYNSQNQSPNLKQDSEINFIQQNKQRILQNANQANQNSNNTKKKNSMEELKYRIQKKTNVDLVLGKNNYQNQHFVNQIGNSTAKNGHFGTNLKVNQHNGQMKRSQTPVNHNQRDLQQNLVSDKKDINDENNLQNSSRDKKKSIKQTKVNHIVQISHLSKAGANLMGTKTNQDNFIVKKSLNGKPDRYLFGVFDGHGQFGHQVSAFLRNTLVRKIENNLAKDLECEDDEFIRSCLNLSFMQTSQALLESQIEIQFSGSTCVCVLIINETIWSANVGDSRAVISRGQGFSSYKAEELSEDQKVDSPLELQRILAKGGRAEPYRDENGGQLGPYRVWLKDQDIPGLAMARSFGDIVATEAGVISTPEIKKFEMTEDDRYIVLASDGVWEFINSQQASNMVQSFYVKNQPDQACVKLVKESTQLWKQNDEVIDDITAVVVFFKRPTKGNIKNNLSSHKNKNNNGEYNDRIFQ